MGIILEMLVLTTIPLYLQMDSYGPEVGRIGYRMLMNNRRIIIVLLTLH